MSAEVSAPAKIILFGEHAVVYGQPAIAVPVSSLRATATILSDTGRTGLRIEAVDLDEVLPVELDADMVDNALALTAQMILRQIGAEPPDATIRVTSTIPMASGLGSGAAVSTAVARAVSAAVGLNLTNEHLNAIIYEVEGLYHGTPSGIDNTVIVYEKPVYFVRDRPIQTLKIGAPLTFVIGDTGVPALTKVTVGDVRTLHQRDPAQIQAIFDAIGATTQQARDCIANGDQVTLGALMLENHAHLQTLTVSSPELDALVKAAMDADALGAKLSGGGRGGNMIALTTPENAPKVATALKSAGAVAAIQTEVK